MKFAPSNQVLALLFIILLAVSVGNTFLVLYNNDAAQKQRTQDLYAQNQLIQTLNQSLSQAINQATDAIDKHSQTITQTIEALNQTNADLNQTYTELNQTDYRIQNLLNGKIDNLNARLPIEQYDYIIYQYRDNLTRTLICAAKNGITGNADFVSTDAAVVFNLALTNGKSIYIKSGVYYLNSDINLTNHRNARIDSDGATLNLNGHKLVISGTSYENSQNNQISGLIIFRGTVRIENSFKTTVTNMIFDTCTVGLELINTNTWTEGTRIDTAHFTKCTQGIVFRTNTTSTQPDGNTTGSYASTEINRCYFNQLENSIAITVEEKAEFTDSQMQDIRIWTGEDGKYNQTGLQIEGSMYKTVMKSVVFESFAKLPLNDSLLYAIKIYATAYEPPIIGTGVNILGAWTARVYNPDGSWIYGIGAVFKQTGIAVPVGTDDYGEAQIFQLHPAIIASFKPKITVDGSFQSNEAVTVRFRLEFIDNVVSNPIEKTFTSSGSVWLDDEDFLQLYGYLDLLYAIHIDAKASDASNATVKVDIYGTTT
ncbi:MAG: hypothetical protein NWF05_03420 [Candidatus Bathyarchaeota archaeon]|nr:hypothetical protein [Candidatus Bathyarchaeota archaeon]